MALRHSFRWIGLLFGAMLVLKSWVIRSALILMLVWIKIWHRAENEKVNRPQVSDLWAVFSCRYLACCLNKLLVGINIIFTNKVD